MFKNRRISIETLLSGRVKSKYISGKVGDLSFTCKVCQERLKCESFYGHCALHENQSTKNKDESQPLISDFSMKNIQREQFEFELIKFIVANNLSFSLIEPLISFLKTLKDQDFIRQVDFSKIDRSRGSIMVNKCISTSIRESIEKKLTHHLIT